VSELWYIVQLQPDEEHPEPIEYTSNGVDAEAARKLAEECSRAKGVVIGMRTIIDENAIYPADLSSPFFHEDTQLFA
jgi:hypothetical protein